MKKITAPTNPLIKDIVALRTSKGRREQGLFIAEGTRTIETLAIGGMRPLTILATDRVLDTGHQFAVQNGAELIEVTDAVMNKISSSSTPSGILATFAVPSRPALVSTPGVVLDHISDPGNMGTLIRSAVAFGYKTVAIIGGVDCWSPKVIQSCAGTIAQATIVETSWKTLLAQENRPKLCALVVTDGKNPADLVLKDHLLVIGNEAHGIDPRNAAACDKRITLAMPGNTESLNAAIAGSIALYLGMIHQR